MKYIKYTPTETRCFCGRKILTKVWCDRPCCYSLEGSDNIIIDLSEIKTLNSVFLSALITRVINKDKKLYLMNATLTQKEILKLVGLYDKITFIKSENEVKE